MLIAAGAMSPLEHGCDWILQEGAGRKQGSIVRAPVSAFLVLGHDLVLAFSSSHRGCTDIICCILLLIAIVGYVIVGVVGMHHVALSSFLWFLGNRVLFVILDATRLR